MGYTTDFTGKFDLDRPLDDKTFDFLKKLAETRRMKRRLGPEFGVEGEFFVGGSGWQNPDGDDSSVVDHNMPPRTQPSLWCQWTPSDDRKSIAWDGVEKFYEYVEWLEWIIKNVLTSQRFTEKPYVLNGTVSWEGEDSDDVGEIVVTNNRVKARVR